MISLKENRATEKSIFVGVERIAKHNAVNVPCKVNLARTDWLSYLRTQLKAFVGRIGLRSKRYFFSADLN